MLLPLACLRQACACLERRFSLDVTGSMSFGKTRPLSSMCHNSTLSVYGMSEHWALTFPKPTRQFKDIPSYNLALICSSNKSFRISCKGLSETPLHFIFRYKGDSVGRYRRYGLMTRLIRGSPLIQPQRKLVSQVCESVSQSNLHILG